MSQQNGSGDARLAATTTPPPPPLPRSKGGEAAQQDKVLSASANLAQLLPTGSVMAYQALSSSFNNHGECYASNWWLTVSLVTFLTVFCIFFAFTDSIHLNGKVYYGVATRRTLMIFNDDEGLLNFQEEKNGKDTMGQQGAEQIEELTMGGHEAVVAQTDEKKLKLEQEELKERLEKLKLNWLDGLHAFFTAVVFLSVAFSDVGLQRCLFPHASRDTMELLKNMPLGMSFLSSFVFMIFPTTRHGIGFSNPNNSSTTSKKVGPGDVEAPAPQGTLKMSRG